MSMVPMKIKQTLSWLYRELWPSVIGCFTGILLGSVFYAWATDEPAHSHAQDMKQICDQTNDMQAKPMAKWTIRTGDGEFSVNLTKKDARGIRRNMGGLIKELKQEDDR